MAKRFKNIFSDAETFKVKDGLIKEIGKKKLIVLKI